MQEPVQGSFTITREYRNSPEIVFRAVSDPIHKRRYTVAFALPFGQGEAWWSEQSDPVSASTSERY